MKLILKAIKDIFQGKAPLLGAKRSGHWPKVRADFLSKNPTCAACGGKDSLEVHHVEPFHINPSLELDESNLITLCESSRRCHLEIGHHGRWSNVNPNVVEEAATALAKISLPSVEVP